MNRLKYLYNKYKTELIPVALILSISLIIRLVYIKQISANPFFYNLFGDPMFFNREALSILNENFMGSQVFFRAPLYSYFVAGIYWLSNNSLWAVRITQVFLSTAAVLFTYIIAKKLFNFSIALVSMILVAFNGILIYFQGEILIPTLLTLLFLIFIYLLIQAELKFSSPLFFWAGVVMGLAALTRPNILIFYPLYLISLIFKYRRKSIKKLLWLTLGLILLIFPITLRNYAVGNDLVLIASQGGVIFYIGNNENSDGKSAVIPEVGDDWDEVSLAERAVGHTLKPSQVSSYWLKRGLHFIYQQPLSFLKLTLKKTWYFFHGYEIGNNQDIYLFSKHSPLLQILLFKINLFPPLGFFFPSGILIPLALVGMIMSFKKRSNIVSVLILLIIAYSLSIIIFFVCSRYRVPLIPFLCILGAYCLYRFYHLFKGRKFLKLSIAGGGLLLCTVGLNLQIFNYSSNPQAMEHFNRGLIYLQQNEYDQAREEFQTSLSHSPRYQRAHLNIGLTYYYQGKYQQALHHYQQEMQINPNESRTYNNIAVIYSAQGNNREAVQMWKRAVQLNPRYSEAYLNLGVKYEQLDSLDQAGEIYAKLLEVESQNYHALVGLARVFQNQNNLPRAIIYLRKAIQEDPHNYQAYYNLGVIYIEQGDFNKARDYFKDALQRNPRSVQSLHNLGMIFLHQNNLVQAQHYFNSAVQVNPSFIPSHQALAEIYKIQGNTDRYHYELNLLDSLQSPR